MKLGFNVISLLDCVIGKMKRIIRTVFTTHQKKRTDKSLTGEVLCAFHMGKRRATHKDNE